MLAPSKGTDLYEDIKQYHKLILDGTVISIDPSVGSYSSLPGYAVLIKGQLVESGVIEMPLGTPIHTRLQALSRKLRTLYNQYQPDVLAYENVPPQRYGGGNAEAHASLLKAVGVVLSIPGPVGYIRLQPRVWKRLVRETYEKGDRQDAEEIGWITYSLSRIAQEENWSLKKSTKKAKSKKVSKDMGKQGSD
jgi:hypothetical protein